MVIENTSNNNYIYYTALPGTHLKKAIELSINLSLQKDKIINLEFNGYNHDIKKLSVNDSESYTHFLYKNWYTDKIEKEFFNFKSLLRDNKINIILNTKGNALAKQIKS